MQHQQRKARQKARQTKEVRSHLIASFLLVLLGLFFLGALVLAIGSKVDSVCYRIADPAVYNANGCQQVTGVAK